MAQDTVPMSEVEKEDPRLEYPGPRACEWDQRPRNNSWDINPHLWEMARNEFDEEDQLQPWRSWLRVPLFSRTREICQTLNSHYHRSRKVFKLAANCSRCWVKSLEIGYLESEPVAGRLGTRSRHASDCGQEPPPGEPAGTNVIV